MKSTCFFYENNYNKACAYFLEAHKDSKIISMSGSNSGEVTPVSIPNTEVKLSSADGSWGFAPARVRRRQAY